MSPDRRGPARAEGLQPSAGATARRPYAEHATTTTRCLSRQRLDHFHLTESAATSSSAGERLDLPARTRHAATVGARGQLSRGASAGRLVGRSRRGIGRTGSRTRSTSRSVRPDLERRSQAPRRPRSVGATPPRSRSSADPGGLSDALVGVISSPCAAGGRPRTSTSAPPTSQPTTSAQPMYCSVMRAASHRSSIAASIGILPP